jgi:heme A synthase
MNNDTKKDDGSPKFGLLLMVLVVTVAALGVLTYVMSVYFPDFPS